MKNILITGKNSYIGQSIEQWLLREPREYVVDTIDMKSGSWREQDFSEYDVVFHVAGIAHIKETNQNNRLYYRVNRDLAYETAELAKKSGVKHFIFLSSMSVYGIESGFIDKNTPLNPSTSYGKSKAQAEKLIGKLADKSFTISIIRPPIVYGKNCKGNYPKLARLARISPIFPKVDNKRSMIYIYNLSEFVKQVIDSRSGGLFFPQNSEYVNTSQMVELIAKAHDKKIRLTRLFNPIIRLLNFRVINKVFGDLVYDMSISECESDYRVCGFEESVEETESRGNHDNR